MAIAYCDPCLFMNKINTADFWCSECKEHYCDKCQLDHTKFQILRPLDIIKKGEKNKDDSTQINDRGVSFKKRYTFDWANLSQSVVLSDYLL